MPRKKKNLNEPTPKEKVQLLYGDGSWTVRGVPRLKIPSLELHDGPLGLRKPSSLNSLDTKDPKIIAATCYPAPCLLACSWDPHLEAEVGKWIGLECRKNNTQMLLAPALNIKRNPLCGRNFEYFSEDPLLSGKMAAGFVNGIQSVNVGACLKHFAVNSQEYYRMVNDSIVDERALREIYLKGFEIAVKDSHPWAIMASYNKVNGTYACENPYLLKTILRGEWGYDGVVMSDWGAVNDPILSHKNGLDLQMPCYEPQKKELLKEAKHDKKFRSEIDESARRIIEMDKKGAAPYKGNLSFDEVKAHRVAVEAAEHSAVLLKNREGVLPLKDFSSCCAIGEFARSPRFEGGGSSRVVPLHLSSFLDALKENGENTEFAPGYDFDGVWRDDDTERLIEAVDLASKSETVLLFLGLPEGQETEGIDRSHLHLPEEQLRLFDSIYEVNQNIVVILSCGSPVELPFRNKAKAILLMYLPGEGGGEATRDLLLGKVSPSGKLAETWPEHLAHVPSFGFYPGEERSSIYRESIYVGYRYYLSVPDGREVAYPFGYGESYASFSYSPLLLDLDFLKKGQSVHATLMVKNTSNVDAENVLELYERPLEKGKAFKPYRTLIDFQKIFLKAGEEKKVEFEIPYDAFQIWDVDSKGWKVEGGKVQIEVCSSCEDVESDAEITLVSEDVFVSHRLRMGAYYSPSKDGFLQYDNDFETLYGKPIRMNADPKSRPYDLNSTFSDITGTRFGKNLMAKQSKRMQEQYPDDTMMLVSMQQSPLRNVGLGGMKMKYAYAIRDMANGHPLKAFNDILFNRKKGK